ncbi:MAG: efflux RND transporter periplasmic adaptor subunit [Sulfurospirillaceae bacterium]|nr:efflux RND transporter periplasmic adaptor subunit [Sulfurospirillaceae bacterium]
MTTKQIIVNIIASVAIIGSGAYVSKHLMKTAPKAQKQQQQKQPTLVQTIIAEPSSETIIIETTGTVEEAKKTTLNANVSGKIIQTSENMILGGIFEKNEEILRIDPQTYENALAQKKAQLINAKASLQIELGAQESAKKELELSGINPSEISKSLILREPQLEQAKASVMQAQTALSLAEKDLLDTKIYAPFKGIVTKKYTEVGGYLGTQSSIVDLVGVDEFWIKVSIALSNMEFFDNFKEEALSKIEVWVKPSNTKSSLKGKIIKFLPELDSKTKQAQLVVAIEDPLNLKAKNKDNAIVLLGDTVTLDIKGRTYDEVYSIDSAYVRQNNTIWTLDKDNLLHIKPINILFKDSQKTIISEGVSQGDKIVTTYLGTPIEGTKYSTDSNPKNKGKQ